MRNETRALVGAVAVGALLAVAGAGAADKEPSGKEAYREYCKPCHTAESKAGEVTPMTLTQEQWQRFFDKKLQPSHEKVVDEKHGGKRVPEILTPEMLKKIRQFAIDHAADSESPATCG